MSGQTKAALQAEVERLNKEISRLQTKATESSIEAKYAIAGKDELIKAVHHYRAQRDTLTGYVEGVRLDRDETIMTRPDPYAEPVKSTRTDEFLESMMREPPPIGRTF